VELHGGSMRPGLEDGKRVNAPGGQGLGARGDGASGQGFEVDDGGAVAAEGGGGWLDSSGIPPARHSGQLGKNTKYGCFVQCHILNMMKILLDKQGLMWQPLAHEASRLISTNRSYSSGLRRN
jgi:hypothetical protein